MKTNRERRKEKFLKMEEKIENLELQFVNKIELLKEENKFLKTEFARRINQSNSAVTNDSAGVSEHKESEEVEVSEHKGFEEFDVRYIHQLENENKNLRNQVQAQEEYINQLEQENEKSSRAVQNIQLNLDRKEKKILILGEQIEILGRQIELLDEQMELNYNDTQNADY